MLAIPYVSFAPSEGEMEAEGGDAAIWRFLASSEPLTSDESAARARESVRLDFPQTFPPKSYRIAPFFLNILSNTKGL